MPEKNFLSQICSNLSFHCKGKGKGEGRGILLLQGIFVSAIVRGF